MGAAYSSLGQTKVWSQALFSWAIALPRGSHKQIIHAYTLHQQTLDNVQFAKYLGITITEVMDWGQLISDISSKATRFHHGQTRLWFLCIIEAKSVIVYTTVCLQI